MKRGRPFTLLEVMLALAVLAIAITPILGVHSGVIKQEINLSRQLDLDREAADMALEAVRQLVRKEIPFDVITEATGQEIYAPSATLLGFKQTRTFNVVRQKPAGTEPLVFLIDLQQSFGPITYHFPIVLDRRAVAQAEASPEEPDPSLLDDQPTDDSDPGYDGTQN